MSRKVKREMLRLVDSKTRNFRNKKDSDGDAQQFGNDTFFLSILIKVLPDYWA